MRQFNITLKIQFQYEIIEIILFKRRTVYKGCVFNTFMYEHTHPLSAVVVTNINCKYNLASCIFMKLNIIGNLYCL